ncbi:hypothetical protein BOVAC2_1419 [Bacteroides ovatus]|nr:hypothetical protein BOVAC2_1419 [Bacteroides ovatus]
MPVSQVRIRKTKTTNIAYPTIYLGISVRRLALIIIAQSYEKTI